MDHNCPNCGAPITGRQCEYCGTVFKQDFPHDTFIVERPGARVLRARCTIDNFMATRPGVADFMKHKLASEMTAALADAMKIVVSDDPYQQVVIVEGEIRVLDPSFMF